MSDLSDFLTSVARFFVKIYFHKKCGVFEACKKAIGFFDTLKKPLSFDRGFIYGAGNETRTRYLHLGKVALYRMSYARTRNEINDTTFFGFVKHNLSRSSIFTYYR